MNLRHIADLTASLEFLEHCFKLLIHIWRPTDVDVWYGCSASLLRDLVDFLSNVLSGPFTKLVLELARVGLSKCTHELVTKLLIISKAREHCELEFASELLPIKICHLKRLPGDKANKVHERKHASSRHKGNVQAIRINDKWTAERTTHIEDACFVPVVNGAWKTLNWVVLDAECDLVRVILGGRKDLSDFNDAWLTVRERVGVGGVEIGLHGRCDCVLTRVAGRETILVLLLHKVMSANSIQVRIEHSTRLWGFNVASGAHVENLDWTAITVLIVSDGNLLSWLHAGEISLAEVAGDDQAINDGARVIRVRVIFSTLQRLERVSTMEVLRDVTTISSLEKESTARMTPLELSHIQNEIIQDHKLLIALLHDHLELLFSHDVQRLIESYGLFPEEALMCNL